MVMAQIWRILEEGVFTPHEPRHDWLGMDIIMAWVSSEGHDESSRYIRLGRPM
jgi:hypothetical protein